MSTLTIRTQAEHDEAITVVGRMLGEKTASQTLLKSLLEYQKQHDEIQRLKRELRETQCERNEYRDKISRYRQAHRDLMA